jgi:membrane protease YdiL (CAAX protease family)
MTIVRALPASKRTSEAVLGVAAVSAGIVVLLARRSVLGTQAQVPVLIQIYAAVAVIALVVPSPGGDRRLSPAIAAALGIGAFVVASLATRSPAVFPHGPQVLLLNSAAALSEEVFFRRLVYGVLARHPAWIAIVGSAVLFALVHVPIYGPAAFGVDLCAGLLLAWQRWASGSWVPAGVTHVAGNLLAVLR